MKEKEIQAREREKQQLLKAKQDRGENASFVYYYLLSSPYFLISYFIALWSTFSDIFLFYFCIVSIISRMFAYMYCIFLIYLKLFNIFNVAKTQKSKDVFLYSLISSYLANIPTFYSIVFKNKKDREEKNCRTSHAT